MASEKALWQWFSRGAAEHWRNACHLTRVENRLSPGAPDVEGCIAGTSFWLELKYENAPKYDRTPVKLRFQENQPYWYRRRWTAGGKVCLLVQIGDTRFLLPTSIWQKASYGMLVSQYRERSLIPVVTTPKQIVETIRDTDLCSAEYYPPVTED